jgi:eukaryotic-like serine/threonine-protein kinase
LSTSVIEPGTRLAGRYRLDDRVSEAGGSTFWKATDEILARPVAVLTFAPGFPRVHDVVTAARAASRLTDPRLTQVFDADDSGEQAYVVSEWVTGETLEDLIIEGPMEPGRAAAFVLEAAEALASAHAAGQAHLCLTPHNLVWTSGGTVKVTGLGVEAVLAGSTSEAPAAEDTQGLGQLLYAALTGHWCGPEGTQLPTAPSGPDGRPIPPGQLRRGMPQNIDEITCRSLHIPVRGAQEPLNAPAAFVGALSKVPRSPLPFVPLGGSTPGVVSRPDNPPHSHSSTSTSPVDPLSHTVPDPGSSRTQRTSGPPRSPRPAPVRHAAGGGGGGAISRPVLAAIVVGVLILVALGGWGLSRMGGGDDGGTKEKAGAKTSTSAKPTALKLKVSDVTAYNRGAHPDDSAPKDLSKATDSDKSSAWTTQHYTNANYGGLRSGVGLVLDMGKSVTVANVKVLMPPGTPGTVELHIGNSGSPSAPQISSGEASGSFELDGKQAKGRYVMLWFTKLPDSGGFQATVRDVAVYGTE